MRGEFIGVWTEIWTEVWEDLIANEAGPNDMFCELYRSLVSALRAPPGVEALADIIDDPELARQAFAKTPADAFIGERALVEFLENAHMILDDLGGDALGNHYFNNIVAFINKYSLRYDLRRPCILCPTLSGVFASLVRNWKAITGRDAHLDGLMKDFEESIRDLRVDCSDRRIKTCIQKQVNLLEAMGRTCPGVSRKTLGAICNQVGTWPHEKIKEAMQSLYGFASDYPGIRHSGTPANAIRNIEMRDMVAISILLAGFTPYLSDQIDAAAVYRGS